MVGARDRVARVRSTSGPATELIITVEWEKRAARVRQRQYEFVKVSTGRKVSEAEKRCTVGSEVMSEPTAAARFWWSELTSSAWRRKTYLLGEFDDLGWVANSALPEEDDIRGLGGVCGQGVVGVAGVLDQLVPDGDIYVAADAVGNLAPVHVAARLLDGPDDLAQGGDVLRDGGQREGAGLGDDGVGARLLEELGQAAVGLHVGDEDGGEAVEGAGEDDDEQLEAVGQVDGDAAGVVIVQVLSDDGHLLGDAGDVVLGELVRAQDGHEGSGAGGAGLLLEGDLARDAAPDVAQVAVLAGRVHGRAGGLDGEAGAQRVCWRSAGERGQAQRRRTAMGHLGAPEDGRLARLAHVRSLCLAGQQQRVRVGVGVAGDEPDDEGEQGHEQGGRVGVPAGEQVPEGAVQLLQKAGHRVGKGLYSRSWHNKEDSR